MKKLLVNALIALLLLPQFAFAQSAALLARPAVANNCLMYGSTIASDNKVVDSGITCANPTGTGALVRKTNPALVTPDLGTPSAINLTNATLVPMAQANGTLAASKGGLGQNTYTVGDIFYASGTSAISKLGIGSTNQVLSVIGGIPSWVPAGSGTVTTTGSPASGNLAAFSGGVSITNSNLSGDCATAGTLASVCLKTNGVSFGTFATANAATPPAIGGTTPAAGAFTTVSASGKITPTSTIGIQGTVTNDNPCTGCVGEYVSTTGTSTTLPSAGTTTTLATQTLTAGDWDAQCAFEIVPGTTTSSLTVAVDSFALGNMAGGGIVVNTNNARFVTPTVRKLIAVGGGSFTCIASMVAAANGSGQAMARARRVR